MSERKIRLTLSSKLYNGVGALIDVDFDSENLDVDLDITAEYGVATLIKEYTVNVAAGIYNLDISYKNDDAVDSDNDGVFELDRNLIIEKIEFANDGMNYENLLVNSANSNLENGNYQYVLIPNTDYNSDLPKSRENHTSVVNPNFDPLLPESDYISDETVLVDPGPNPYFLYNLILNPIKIYNSSTATFQIEFS